MDDVTALILTVGEATTSRALRSVENQNRPVADTVVIENVTPFHKALNLGVASIRTPFFIQVDADMVLDADCVEALRACLEDGVGIAVGMLRDPLCGRIVGIKMFRTACFARGGFPDSVSPDTDFGAAIAGQGWQTVYALRFTPDGPEGWHTFGEHRPHYTPHYTFSKYLIEGRRYRYRRAFRPLIGHLDLLAKSPHEMALIAQVALAHGVFLAGERDLLVPCAENDEWRGAQALLLALNRIESQPRLRCPWSFMPLAGIFLWFYAWGASLRRRRASARFAGLLARLTEARNDEARIARIGLCHGLFADRFDWRSARRDWSLLAGFLPSMRAGGSRKFLPGLARRLLGRQP